MKYGQGREKTALRQSLYLKLPNSVYGVGNLPDDNAYGANYLLWNEENIIWINGDEKIWLLDLTQRKE